MRIMRAMVRKIRRAAPTLALGGIGALGAATVIMGGVTVNEYFKTQRMKANHSVTVERETGKFVTACENRAKGLQGDVVEDCNGKNYRWLRDAYPLIGRPMPWQVTDSFKKAGMPE